MAGRGSTTFQKRQKEQQRKEKRAEKLARRQSRKLNPPPPGISDEPLDLDDNIVDDDDDGDENLDAETAAAVEAAVGRHPSSLS